MGLNKSTSMGKSSTDLLKEEQIKCINKSYKVGKDTQEVEIVNILNDYAWARDVTVGNASSIDITPEGTASTIEKKNNIPFCYVVERRSAANAGIANIFNLINHIKQTADQTKGIVEDLISRIYF